MTRTASAAAPTVAAVQSYLADLGRGDARAAAARFGADLTYLAPGRNRLAGETHGPDAAARWFAAMTGLSGGTYRMVGPVDWLASDGRALLLAREHATVAGRDHDWTRALVFDVRDGLIHRVQLLEDDQRAYDGWLAGDAGTPAPAGSAGGAEPARPVRPS